ncbi:hypothetical protein HPB51_017234 [Rhipicephalus microplus]|uniref:Uncharacterized protein n=1 Tax=Rhipicephalus microplus TaxID=6941 RepID=A0A9J6EAV1_RHIMP|nr:hypothetical protein HPB51_017234 [Rhipicephalus microplus]
MLSAAIMRSSCDEEEERGPRPRLNYTTCRRESCVRPTGPTAMRVAPTSSAVASAITIHEELLGRNREQHFGVANRVQPGEPPCFSFASLSLAEGGASYRWGLQQA